MKREVLIVGVVLTVIYFLTVSASIISNNIFDKSWKEFKEGELDETKSDKKNKAHFWYKASVSLENFSRIYMKALVIGYLMAIVEQLIEQGISHLFH